jgi:hypothetical protein
MAGALACLFSLQYRANRRVVDGRPNVHKGIRRKFHDMTMTSTAVDDPELAARGTLALLEARLHKLEFLLSGRSDGNGTSQALETPATGKDSLHFRLEALEAGLAKLKRLTGRSGGLLRDMDRLCG